MAIEHGDEARSLAARFIRPDTIYDFVRNRLGCQCPEEVFDDIIVGFPSIFKGISHCALQILIGNRLFLALVRTDRLSEMTNEVRTILQQGKLIRDDNGFNRFRLVLIGAVEEKTLMALQMEADGMDDRVHVHHFPESVLSEYD
jgi:hypothetical protein